MATTIVIRGRIRLPARQRLDHATAIVGIDDVGLIDAPAVRVAEVVIEALDGEYDTIPFALPVDASRLASAACVVSAEIRRSGRARRARGDFLTTTSYPLSPTERSDLVIDVEQI
jgi:uncharacterized lipoprotein YbaY